MADLFQDPRVLRYDVLIVQEPWRNLYITTSYHPLKEHFQLTYLEDVTTRVYFYINKRIDPSTWSVSYITKDIIALEITSPSLYNKLCVINVYNKVVTNTLHDLREVIGRFSPRNELLVLRDFNLYHSL